MVEQFAGVVTAAVLVICYLLILEAMTAAALILAQYIVVQARNLRGIVASSQPLPVVESRSYQVGGGIRRWE